jgi:hypothetical protein
MAQDGPRLWPGAAAQIMLKIGSASAVAWTRRFGWRCDPSAPLAMGFKRLVLKCGDV